MINRSTDELELLTIREAAEDRRRNQPMSMGQHQHSPECQSPAWKTLALFLSGILIAVIPLLSLQLMNFTPRSEMQQQLKEIQAFEQNNTQEMADIKARITILSQQMQDLKEQNKRLHEELRK